MDAQTTNPSEASIGELFGQLADDGRSLVRAEVDLYKKIALRRAGKASGGLVALVAGGVLLLAALIVAMVGLALGLANYVGPVAGGLIVAAAAGLIGFVLIRMGLGKMKALGGDSEEKEAIATGERLA